MTMRIKHYKLKDGVTRDYLIKCGCKEGGTWITKDADIFISKDFVKKGKGGLYFEMSIGIAFSSDLSKWDDFKNILVMDEAFCQPYTPFYGDNYGAEIKGFPALEWTIQQYNDWLSSLPFLEEII